MISSGVERLLGKDGKSIMVAKAVKALKAPDG
jgi:hypothetical protein